MFNKKPIFILAAAALLLQSCGTMFDVAGKGAKTTCLSLNTQTRTIECHCEAKKIASITIYKNKNAKENFGQRTHQFVLNPTVNSFVLPVSTDSLDTCFFQIEIHLTDSHWRESYYLDTEPGDFSKPRIVYSRYFSH